jgi:hypothetical protein
MQNRSQFINLQLKLCKLIYKSTLNSCKEAVCIYLMNGVHQLWRKSNSEKTAKREVWVLLKRGAGKREGESTDINFCCWQLAALTEACYHNTHSDRRD